MRKRVWAMVLAVAMVVSLMVVPVSAAEVVDSGTCGDDLTWVLDGDYVLTISGTGEMENYSAGRNLYQSGYVYYSFASWGDYRESITAVVIDTGVTKIGEYAFYGCSALTSVCISDSVLEIDTYAFGCCANLNDVAFGNGLTKIGEAAFFECTRLDSITIPDSMTSIGSRAFIYCSGLASVSIGNAVTSIDSYAFYECESLVNMVIPDNVTSIGEFVFTGCTSLESITIGSGVTKIGGSYGEYSAFTDCSALTSIIVSTDNPTYSSIDGVLFDKEQTQLIKYPAGNLKTSYVVPDTVTVIERYAFSCCTNLTNVKISDNVVSIGDYAFYKCSGLTEVTISNNATGIGTASFLGCSSLTTVTIPDSVTSIGKSAFNNCYNLINIIIGGGVTSIKDYAFQYCTSLTDVYYIGSEEDWNTIDIGNYNERLTNATIHYNSTGAEDENVDYTWIFGEDNFCFTNSDLYFGSGAYYIEDDMFNAYLDTLDNTQITSMAKEYGSYSIGDRFDNWLRGEETDELYYRVANFICNNLKSWGGACYGMSLVATLIKTGNLSAEDLGAATTYELPALNSDDNTTLESIINLYHISQKTASVFNTDNYKYGFGGVIEMMWDIASSIGDGEQPFLVYLNSSDGDDGHCVVCYGAETGEYSTGSLLWKEEYTMRLLIYDPNSGEEEYLYISDDFNSVDITCDDGLFSGCEFEVFGFYANETTFVETLDIDHSIYLDVDNMLVYQYTIYSSDGSYAEVSDGTIVGGTLGADIVWTASVLADDEEVEAENEIYTVYLPDDAEYYRIVPAEGETLDALITFDDFSINVSGTMESATIYADGTVEVAGAEGDLSIDVTLNNSEFDFVGIAGSADGDVTVYVSDESITVTGDLTDYVVENMNRDCETDGVSVEDDTDIKVTVENETVVAYADLDGDGEYETEISDNDATNPFTDVNTGHYFYNAVLWAVDNGITSGTSDTTFSPFLTAERCQVVAFLWRAAGCPEPTSTENPFTDVNEGDYFYTAVLWAVEQGITTGTSDTTFSPYNKCERCQVVTFLYRYFGKPEVTNTSNPFTDVDTDDYFYNAVLWAVDNGITTGTSDTTFGPFVTCERCMVVTFLYRAAQL